MDGGGGRGPLSRGDRSCSALNIMFHSDARPAAHVARVGVRAIKRGLRGGGGYRGGGRRGGRRRRRKRRRARARGQRRASLPFFRGPPAAPAGHTSCVCLCLCGQWAKGGGGIWDALGPPKGSAHPRRPRRRQALGGRAGGDDIAKLRGGGARPAACVLLLLWLLCCVNWPKAGGSVGGAPDDARPPTPRLQSRARALCAAGLTARRRSVRAFLREEEGEKGGAF